MMLLVSGGTKTVARIDDPALGELLRPGNGNLPTKPAWAVDNGAFSGFDADEFTELLGRVEGRSGCLWVAAPDVVADAVETTQLFRAWEPLIRGRGFPVAYVTQDGEGVPPWNKLDCLFVGGTTRYKLSKQVEGLAREAKARGKLVHVGRVNTLNRMRHCLRIGADTFDGTAFSMYPDTKIPWALQGLKTMEYRHAFQKRAMGGWQ